MGSNNTQQALGDLHQEGGHLCSTVQKHTSKPFRAALIHCKVHRKKERGRLKAQGPLKIPAQVSHNPTQPSGMEMKGREEKVKGAQSSLSGYC